ncbi:type II toxin-antitoxin system RelE family toxin [Lusitaniella coriacea]|uniref:type II toxin-antitoxin system RelE family toxin n=1 Tax=Lusitaniella coriacea TaxID=1983105 RepID=UPI003CE77307
MRYKIVFSPEAEEDIAILRSSDRAKVLDIIEIHLRHEPEKISKSRIKRLRAMQQPQYRLRVDNLRVFYDVIYTIDGGVVEILAIKEKNSAIAWLDEHGRTE